MAPHPTPTPTQNNCPVTSVEGSTVAPRRRFTLAVPTVTIEDVVEWLKVHSGTCPRDMSRSRKDVKNRLIYFFLFAEVQRRHPNRVRTEWRTIGDGLGCPSRQLHYFWVH